LFWHPPAVPFLCCLAWARGRGFPAWRPAGACHPSTIKGMTLTIVDEARPVTGGVHTHAGAHVAAALDGIGGPAGGAGVRRDVGGVRAVSGLAAGLRHGVPGRDRGHRQLRRRAGPPSGRVPAAPSAAATVSTEASSLARSMRRCAAAVPASPEAGSRAHRPGNRSAIHCGRSCPPP
jgi:hypothetical protein